MRAHIETVLLRFAAHVPAVTGPDPTPLLSTIAATSAAMVAIVGGLLVARFVTIASEQEGAEQLVRDARERLTTARKREHQAREELRDWETRVFFEMKLIKAIGDGETQIPILRKLGRHSPLTDDELNEGVQSILTEFEMARSVLGELLANAHNSELPTEWDEFASLNASHLPETSWDEVWEIVYRDTVWPPQPRRADLFGLDSLPSAMLSMVSLPPEYEVLRLQRRDAQWADLARAQQRADDIEEEFARLQRARDAIVRPKGLGGGMIVLAFFTVVGVIIPIWIMSRGPDRLTAHLGETMFWLFLAGLLALLGYMGVLALRLSGLGPRRGSEATEGGTPGDGSNDQR